MFKVKSIITDNGSTFTEQTFNVFINAPNNYIEPLMCYLINDMEFFAEPNPNGIYTARNNQKYNLIRYTPDKNYVHNQSSAASTWIVQHNLSKFPLPKNFVGPVDMMYLAKKGNKNWSLEDVFIKTLCPEIKTDTKS